VAKLTRSGFLGGAAALAAVPWAGRASAITQYGDAPIAGTVTIAVVAPFTGDAITLGQQLGNGVRAAIDDTNALRGTLDKAFVMRTFDDQNLLAVGLQSAEFACDDATVVCVIGHLSGKITDGALKTYVNNNMPVIVPATTYDPITSHGYGSVLRLPTKDSTEGRLAARNAETALKIENAVVLYQDGDYGLDIAAGFHNQLIADKISSKAIEFSYSKPDFAGVAKATAGGKPDVVYLAGLVRDMGGILPALHDAGYAGPVYASQGFFEQLTTTKYATLAEGLLVSCSMPPLQLAPTDFRVRNNFQIKYGPMTPLSTFAYAAAQIAISGVHRSGATDRLGVARALSYATPFDTVLGTLSFQNDGDPSNPNIYFYTVKNGAWAYVHAAHKTDFILK